MKSFVATGLIASLWILAAGSAETAAPANVVARVNGVDITADQLDAEFARAVAGADPAPDPEQTVELKLQLLSDMIGNEVLLQMAAEDQLTATDAEVEVRFIEFRNQYTQERFAELLEQQQSTEADVRNDIRDSLTIEKLINKEITSRITVSQAEIEEFYQENIESFNLPETFDVAHILVTPNADPTITNSTGDDAATPEDAAAKAQRILNDVRGGMDFALVARQYSEDPTTVSTGGDLGFQPIEVLAGVGDAFAAAAREMRVGETYPRVVATDFGYHVIKLLGRDEGGQKDVSEPQVEAQIRQLIFNRRDQLLRTAFFETVRNNSDVRNYFAERILADAVP